jgi:hypothetical protein
MKHFHKKTGLNVFVNFPQHRKWQFHNQKRPVNGYRAGRPKSNKVLYTLVLNHPIFFNHRFHFCLFFKKHKLGLHLASWLIIMTTCFDLSHLLMPGSSSKNFSETSTQIISFFSVQNVVVLHNCSWNKPKQTIPSWKSKQRNQNLLHTIPIISNVSNQYHLQQQWYNVKAWTPVPN